jgi:hypothetical protein
MYNCISGETPKNQVNEICANTILEKIRLVP